jgi:hypothetical protein
VHFFLTRCEHLCYKVCFTSIHSKCISVRSCFEHDAFFALSFAWYDLIFVGNFVNITKTI